MKDEIEHAVDAVLGEQHVSIRREPFARGDVVRRKADQGECDWCGRKGRLWQYGWDPDSLLPGRTAWDRESFCSIQCRRNYYM